MNGVANLIANNQVVVAALAGPESLGVGLIGGLFMLFLGYVLFAQLPEVTNPSPQTVLINIQTAPSRQEASFVSMISGPLSASAGAYAAVLLSQRVFHRLPPLLA